MRRYHVTTFGCQMNAHDSERIKGLLEELGLGEAPSQDEADVLVFNTCTIREKPDTRLAAHLSDALHFSVSALRPVPKCPRKTDCRGGSKQFGSLEDCRIL